VGDLSQHFSRHEFLCRCGCRRGLPHPDLLRLLELRRTDLGLPINISSGGRCDAHNAAVGGSVLSAHRIHQEHHQAADYRHGDLEGLEEARWWEEHTDHSGGLGVYYNVGPGGLVTVFIHIDTGAYWRRHHPVLPRRWISVNGTFYWLGQKNLANRFINVSHRDLALRIKVKEGLINV